MNNKSVKLEKMPSPSTARDSNMDHVKLKMAHLGALREETEEEEEEEEANHETRSKESEPYQKMLESAESTATLMDFHGASFRANNFPLHLRRPVSSSTRTVSLDKFAASRVSGWRPASIGDDDDDLPLSEYVSSRLIITDGLDKLTKGRESSSTLDDSRHSLSGSRSEKTT